MKVTLQGPDYCDPPLIHPFIQTGGCFEPIYIKMKFVTHFLEWKFQFACRIELSSLEDETSLWTDKYDLLVKHIVQRNRESSGMSLKATFVHPFC